MAGCTPATLLPSTATGYVRITGRKKDLIINAAGKNTSPANIENAARAAPPLIGQAVTVGDRRPYIVALIVLDPDAAAVFATRNGISDPSPGPSPLIQQERIGWTRSIRVLSGRVAELRLLTCRRIRRAGPVMRVARSRSVISGSPILGCRSRRGRSGRRGGCR